MYKVALALLVGLMLSVSGSAWGEYTFKDGVISPSTEVKPDLRSMLDRKLCEKAAWKINNQSLTTAMFSPIYRWRGTEAEEYVREAKRRGLSCGVTQGNVNTVKFSRHTPFSEAEERELLNQARQKFKNHKEAALCDTATWVYENKIEFWPTNNKSDFQGEYPEGSYATLLAKHLGYNCDVGSSDSKKILCRQSVLANPSATKLEWNPIGHGDDYSEEARSKGFNCGVHKGSALEVASKNPDFSILFANLHRESFISISSDGDKVFISNLSNKWFRKLLPKVEKDYSVRFSLSQGDARCDENKPLRPWPILDASVDEISGSRGILIKPTKNFFAQFAHRLNGDYKYLNWYLEENGTGTWVCDNTQNFRGKTKPSNLLQLANSQRRNSLNLSEMTDANLCLLATTDDDKWDLSFSSEPLVEEAKDRGLTCGVETSGSTQIASAGIANSNSVIANQNDITICARAVVNQSWDRNYDPFVKEAASRGISCDIAEPNPFGSGTNKSAAVSSSADLDAANEKALQLEQELAALKAQQEQQQENIAADGQPPVLTAQANVDGSMASIFGSAADNVGVAELLIDGLPVQLSSDGSFETSLYVPRNGKQIEVTVFDLKGNQTDKILSLKRSAVQQASGPVFGSLNPSGKRVMPNNDALALIIGVADYERTPAKAAYADKDAKTFYDYAMLKLGIPASNIKELVNTDAGRIDVRLAVKDWVARSTKQNASDIYVFFAGHGLASQSGEEMYLLPYDGEPRLLEDSAIKRNRLFDDIASANPRSVTVFLDTCYSGTTRGTDMLIASRPIAIKALKQSVPDNFTVMTAAAGDQTAKPLEEAKHGMFSYFLMKGMEGEADANQDNKITAGELHSYVQTNVIQQSSGSQTPELQGDADRVLVQFQ